MTSAAERKLTSSNDEANKIIIGSMECSTQGKPACVSSVQSKTPSNGGEVILDHYIFKSNVGRRKSESMRHPTLSLGVSTELFM